mgnify:CR=1 FL=1
MGPVVPLVATKLAISPFPLALSPILGLSFTHEYVIVPYSILFVLSDNVVEKSTAKVLSPALPLKELFNELPVALILEEPLRYKFSTLLKAVRLTVEKIESVP